MASRDQAQPCFASATTRWNGQQPREGSSFSEVCLLYKHSHKREPSVSDGGIIAGKGEAVILGMAGCVQPAPVSMGEERPCSPSGCQAVQTLLSSTSTLLEQFRDLGEEEATGRRRRGQPGSHAKLLPGSKALLDSEKQFGFHLSFDPSNASLGYLRMVPLGLHLCDADSKGELLTMEMAPPPAA